MPPGNDDLPGKTPPEPEPKRGGGRKPGKQRGAPGAHLEWNEHPDGTRDVFPAGGCACGADLSGDADLGVRYSHQVTDLPEAAATTVQYDRHEVECGCGRRHVADPPPEAPGAPGTVTYGLNFQAWCVFLMVMHHVPVERCADILESMSGTRPSDGWVHGLLGRAAKAVAAANKTIRALIILARVICGDETPIRSGPGPKTAKKKYLQVACTSLLTYYFLGDRDLPSFRNFIYSDLHGSVIVHDRYRNYDAFGEVSHQLCCQHLLRDLKDAAESYPDAIWPGQVADALRGLIHQANLARDQGLASVPDEATAEDCGCSATASASACPGSAASPAARKSSSPPPCTCWNACATGRPMSCGSSPTPPSRPLRTRLNGMSAQRRPSRRSPAGSAQCQSPATGTPSAATHPPRKSTATRSSPRSTTPSPGTPGYRQSRPTPELHPKPVTHRYPHVTRVPECLLRPRKLALVDPAAVVGDRMQNRDDLCAVSPSEATSHGAQSIVMRGLIHRRTFYSSRCVIPGLA